MRVLPLELLAAVKLGFHNFPLSVRSTAPLVAPEPKLVTLRWLPRRIDPKLKMEQMPICPQAVVKVRCLKKIPGFKNNCRLPKPVSI